MVALRKPVSRMSVAEFLAWDSGEGSGARWQLRDGEPVMMAPATDARGSIQGELYRLVSNHLAASGRCRAVINPGVVPRVRSSENFLIPDIGVTCTPPQGGTAMPDPVVLIEILSPSNERETRANVWAFVTIPSVMEIVLLRSTSIAAEVWRRGADGTWPENPQLLVADAELVIDAIGFRVPLRAAYRTSGLT